MLAKTPDSGQEGLRARLAEEFRLLDLCLMRPELIGNFHPNWRIELRALDLVAALVRVGIVDPRPVLVCRSADKEQFLDDNCLICELIIKGYPSLLELRVLKVLGLPALEVIEDRRRPVRVG